MSDKHTEAQGEMQAALESIYPLPDGAVDPSHDERILERREGFRAGWKERSRATEGQAQTSAAPAEKVCDVCSGVGAYGDGPGACECKACSGTGRILVGQLADSAAPGSWSITKRCDMATVFDSAGNEITKVYAKYAQLFVDAHNTSLNAAPTAQQSLTAGVSGEIARLRKALEYYADPKTNAPGAVARDVLAGLSLTASGAVPEFDFDEWMNEHSAGTQLRLDKEFNDFKAAIHKHYAAAALPTPAGGAVPDGEPMPCPCCGADALLQEQEPHRHSQCIAAFMPDHEGSFTVECSVCACAMIANTAAEVLAMWNRRAAAPLPQVQSEALDAGIWQELLKEVMSEIPNKFPSRIGNAPFHGHSIAGIWDSDNGEKAGKECAWCKVWNAARIAIADQQPVTPSGALADNDGGVA